MTQNTTYLLEEFVGTRLGAAYRLFPFGKIVKNGRVREITPESAAMFRLPHFKPAIKLGSHDEPTPAGGHIVGLEVRADGLYAVPEWNDKGESAINDGAYRYHSPEVIWGDGALEDPKTGAMIDGPLILGDALLHTPHLGEDAALYSIEPIQKGDKTMTVETVEVPKGLLTKFNAWLERLGDQPDPQQPEPLKVVETEEYKAAIQERDNFKAQFEALQAEKAKDELLATITAELQDKEKFGAMFIELKGAQEAAEVMGGMDENQREWCMRNFKALVAQSKLGAVEDELGSAGDPAADTDPVAAFDAAVLAIAAEKKLGYVEALRVTVNEQPELYEAYKQAKEK